MKKLIFTIALAICVSGSLFAQAEGSTIGLRFGYPTEISYQKGLLNILKKWQKNSR